MGGPVRDEYRHIHGTLDSSIVVIGLPTILKNLQANLVEGVWIITGYKLMITILLIMFGRLADLYGRVKLYNMGFIIFTIGSLLCALSQNGEQLIIFRFLQGAGAALLISNSTAIITDAFPKEELGMGLGTNMMAANLGVISGYTLSGVLMNFFQLAVDIPGKHPHRHFRHNLGLFTPERNR